MNSVTGRAGEEPKGSEISVGEMGRGVGSPKNLLKAVLLVSFTLRGWIALRGGQWFWPDEGRYGTAQAAAREFLEGHFHRGWVRLFEQADHLLFKVVAVVPALIEQGFKGATWAPALFFAAVSTWVLWLIGRVARAAGADDREELLAVFFAAGAASLFYYARHLLPYDLALGFGLTALTWGISQQTGWWRSLLTGFCAGFCFLSYNGYWTLSAVVLLIHVGGGWRTYRALLLRGVWAFVGLVLPVVAVLGIGSALSANLGASYLAFAKTVQQGDFGIAWRFTAEYFWETEHLVAVAWAMAVGGAVGLLWKRTGERRVLLWLVGVVLLYAALVVPSDVVPKFAVSARHVRVLAPFLCLLLAAVVEVSLRRNRIGGWVVSLLAVGLIVQAGFNFRTPLVQSFPIEFRPLAERFLKEATARDLGPYEIINVGFLHNPDWASAAPDAGEVVYRRAHPFQFSPYLYEGYTEEARGRYRQRDLSMRVVRLAAGGSAFAGFPGVMKMTFQLPTPPMPYNAEPLLTTGRAGSGDVLFFDYPRPAENPSIIRIGHDHWGGGAILSKEITVDRSKPHTLVIVFGSLFPAETEAFFAAHPERKALKRRLYVTLDGAVVFNEERDFNPSLPSEITIGYNMIGASTTTPELTATVLKVERLSPEAGLALLKSAAR